MDDIHTQIEAPTHDPSRQAATILDTDYVLTIEQVADRYAKAGHPYAISRPHIAGLMAGR